ncbi:hypothetical protein BABINDRAFT_162283 [Babjeviella inositovora NRRL Y-12698]|uniref:C2H2-type domain-containing protein n=1 Tax=Babjeviella inositovora NRRL Y-12698 TaxID=984486 RepID=A0A1E3QNN2_9ASCO|nr:uncharacterized protein BABINDRAFT_162283 [Babjeviella inositovora NRRL Y-12698]ODQ79248.1 hypothetical protein BABINDRAFT_162283 [Babjeviella inositovora NRRL Y-12698]
MSFPEKMAETATSSRDDLIDPSIPKHEAFAETQTETLETPGETAGLGQTPEATVPGDDKKFVCKVCSHSFTRKHNLVSHELIHTQERPHTCSVCSSKFRRLHDLKRHEKLHTGEKPYECAKCARKFARCDALVRHNNSQTGCALDESDSPKQFRPPNSVANGGNLAAWKARDAKKGYETGQWKISPALPSINKLAGSAPAAYMHTVPAAAQSETRFRPTAQGLTEREYEFLTYARSLESRVAVLESRLGALEKTEVYN